MSEGEQMIWECVNANLEASKVKCVWFWTLPDSLLFPSWSGCDIFWIRTTCPVCSALKSVRWSNRCCCTLASSSFFGSTRIRQNVSYRYSACWLPLHTTPIRSLAAPFPRLSEGAEQPTTSPILCFAFFHSWSQVDAALSGTAQRASPDRRWRL